MLSFVHETKLGLQIKPNKQSTHASDREQERENKVNRMKREMCWLAINTRTKNAVFISFSSELVDTHVHSKAVLIIINFHSPWQQNRSFC